MGVGWAEDTFGFCAPFSFRPFLLPLLFDWKMRSRRAGMRGKEVEEPGCLMSVMPAAGLGSVAAMVVMINASEDRKLVCKYAETHI
jgi:hypothetical protein